MATSVLKIVRQSFDGAHSKSLVVGGKRCKHWAKSRHVQSLGMPSWRRVTHEGALVDGSHRVCALLNRTNVAPTHLGVSAVARRGFRCDVAASSARG